MFLNPMLRVFTKINLRKRELFTLMNKTALRVVMQMRLRPRVQILLNPHSHSAIAMEKVLTIFRNSLYSTTFVRVFAGRKSNALDIALRSKKWATSLTSLFQRKPFCLGRQAKTWRQEICNLAATSHEILL